MPKDGPSAGVGMVTAIISTLTGIPVRRDVAMTGEVTLRGRVLPIGGLKEKLLAALRGGITKVLIPAENEKDLAEIPANIKEGLEIVAGQPMSTRCWPMRWRRRSCRSNGPRPTSSPRCRPSELAAGAGRRRGVSSPPLIALRSD